MKKYTKPSAQFYGVNSSGFIASGGGCYQHEDTNWYGGSNFVSSGHSVTGYGDIGNCWHWVGNQKW